MSAVVRRHEINKRRKRQAQLRKFRAKLAKATTNTDKQAIVAKLRKLAPWVPDREWLNPGAAATEEKHTMRRAA